MTHVKGGAIFAIIIWHKLPQGRPWNGSESGNPFDWPQAPALLDGLPNGGINITHEAVDRHALSGRGNNLAALDRSGQSGSRFRLRGATRANESVANISAERGVAKGDRVFSLLGRVPELYIGALGTLKNGNGSSVA